MVKTVILHGDVMIAVDINICINVYVFWKFAFTLMFERQFSWVKSRTRNFRVSKIFTALILFPFYLFQVRACYW